jgi:hypothetical protein
MHSASMYTATCVKCFIRSAARNVEMMLVDDQQGCIVVFTIFCTQVQLAVMLKVVIVVESSRTWFLYFYQETLSLDGLERTRRGPGGFFGSINSAHSMSIQSPYPGWTPPSFLRPTIPSS